MDHVYGVVPPVAASVVLYAVPTCPLGSAVVEIPIVAGVTVIAKFADFVKGVALESVTLKVRGVLVTAVVGVPVIRPEALIDNPAGSVPLVSVQLYGVVPPVAASAAL